MESEGVEMKSFEGNTNGSKVVIFNAWALKIVKPWSMRISP